MSSTTSHRRASSLDQPIRSFKDLKNRAQKRSMTRSIRSSGAGSSIHASLAVEHPLDEKPSKKDSPAIVGAVGEIRETHGRMLVAYSVRNQSNHWIEVLPPQIEVSSSGDKKEVRKKDRKHIVEAEQVR
jgi:hypothetical protein